MSLSIFKKINYAVLAFLLLFLSGTPLAAQWRQIGNDIDGLEADENAGISVKLSENGNTVVVGAHKNNQNGIDAGQVRIYAWNGTTWIQRGMSINGESAGDFSGIVDLSSDGNTVAIGASNNDGNGVNAGHVRIYNWNGTTWLQRGLDIDGEAAEDLSGGAINLSSNGNTIAIGAAGNDGNGSLSGHVRIYDWNGTTWVQRGIDIDGEAAADYSGYAVSLSPNGNTVAIGAFGNSGNTFPSSGHIRIYDWNGIAWIQRGLDIDGASPSDNFGISVELSADGNTVAVGAPHGTVYRGYVQVYYWNGTAWIPKGLDIDGENMDENVGDVFSLSANGNTIAIGVPYNSFSFPLFAGHVRIYDWNGTAWIKRNTEIVGEMPADLFGYAISLSPDGSKIAIGAPENDGYATNAGHVRVFHFKGIMGHVYQDFSQDCSRDFNEIGLNSRFLTIQPGNIVVQTNSSGVWYLDSLPIGTYTITADTSVSNWQITCPSTQVFVIQNSDSFTIAPSFGFISTNPCPTPEISIHAPFLRPGFSNQGVYIQVCNQPTGTALMDSIYVIVELDALLTVQLGSLPFTSLGNHQYRVNLNTLYPGQCVDFWLSCHLSINAIPSQTLCMNARLYPVDSCVLDTATTPYSLGNVSPCLLPWDRSSLSVEGYCVGDSVRFVIYNTGDPVDGDMDCFAPVRVYLDGVWILLDSIQLQGGDSIVLMFAGNGQTWRLEADQHPLHPGNSHPNATVENCGTGSWTPNLVNVLPHDDADPIIDIYCGLVTVAIDPNDKTGYPLGIGNTHDILPNQEMEYVIRFQNTGTDTAFTVVIRDTLSMDLDIFSVRSGVSSHDYTFKMYGPRVLEWTFNNIMLPDSNMNELASHGFVVFKVQQAPNLPSGTVLENSASIYFDFNAPIFTNTSWHTIAEELIFLNNNQLKIENALQIKVYPNPTTGLFHIDKMDNEQLDILIVDNLGRTLKVLQTRDVMTDINISDFPAGIYYLSINNGKKLVTQKIVKQ